MGGVWAGVTAHSFLSSVELISVELTFDNIYLHITQLLTYLCTLAGFLATTTKKWHGRWSRGNNHYLAPVPILYVLLPLL